MGKINKFKKRKYFIIIKKIYIECKINKIIRKESNKI